MLYDDMREQCIRNEDLKIHLSRHHQAGPPSTPAVSPAPAVSPTLALSPALSPAPSPALSLALSLTPSPAPPPAPSPAPSPTSGALQVVDFEDMMVIDNRLDFMQMEPIRFSL
ncbi:Hypothetical predicted protein [Mytilus galloprovincialis]|uniref:Uncharacterized protein n=1 Tax=Mytilus galloprovincialis TaxID=29158 RepID=A0A8B6HHK5_MYTGA|nr:Hypothetical predicted protein [Mytilus galloprovincialis]